MDNLELYNKLKSVPKEAQKKITGGRLNGMTDIKPMWRIEKLTEMFGVCGIGWKTEIIDKQIIDGANDEKIAIVDIKLYIRVDNEWSEPIIGTGGSSFVAKETKGLYTNDECFKMAYTDALSVACKSLGMGADIYWGDSKYANEPTKEDALNFVFSSGKYEGKKLTEVPRNYLEWTLGNRNDARLHKMIELATGMTLPSKEEQELRIDLISKIQKLCDEKNVDIEEVEKNFSVEQLSELTTEQMNKCINALERK